MDKLKELWMGAESENPIKRSCDRVGEKSMRGGGQTSEKQFTSGP